MKRLLSSCKEQATVDRVLNFTVLITTLFCSLLLLKLLILQRASDAVGFFLCLKPHGSWLQLAPCIRSACCFGAAAVTCVHMAQARCCLHRLSAVLLSPIIVIVAVDVEHCRCWLQLTKYTVIHGVVAGSMKHSRKLAVDAAAAACT